MTAWEKRYNVALGVGSNLGFPEKNIEKAAELLAEAGLENIKISPIYRTKPVDCIPGTPDFTNCAFTGTWSGTPQMLLKVCQKIEQKIGRPKQHSSHEARIIDIDIELFGESEIDSKELIIPHPRMTERYFVLAPLNDIAPDWQIPNVGSVADALQKITNA